MGQALEHAARSGDIEANLEAASEEGQHLGRRAAQIAPGFQQSKSEVLGGADTLREGLTKQAAVSH